MLVCKHEHSGVVFAIAGVTDSLHFQKTLKCSFK